MRPRLVRRLPLPLLLFLFFFPAAGAVAGPSADPWSIFAEAQAALQEAPAAPIPAVGRELEAYLRRVAAGELLPAQFIIDRLPAVDDSTVLVVGALESLRGHRGNAETLLTEYRRRLDQAYRPRDGRAADFLRRLAWQIHPGTDRLLDEAERLDPGPHNSLFQAGRALAAGDALLLFSSLTTRFAGGPFWQILPELIALFRVWFLSLLLLLLAVSFGRWLRWRPVIRHEAAESGEPALWIDPDRFGRFPGRYLRHGIYLCAALLLFLQFVQLVLVTGPGRLTRVSLALVDLSFDSPDFRPDMLMDVRNPVLVAGTRDYLLAQDRLRRGREEDARAALRRIAVDSPFHAAASYQLGRLAWQEGDAERARQHFLTGLDGAAHPALRLGLFSALKKLGRVHEARRVRDALLRGRGSQAWFRSWQEVAGENGPQLPRAFPVTAWVPSGYLLPEPLQCVFALGGVLAGWFALWTVWNVFSREISTRRIRLCSSCQSFSCDECRTTLDFCPACLSRLDSRLDDSLLAARLDRRNGKGLRWFSLVLPGLACFALGRFRGAAAVLTFFALFFLLCALDLRWLVLPGLSGEIALAVSDLVRAALRISGVLWLVQFLLGWTTRV